MLEAWHMFLYVQNFLCSLLTLGKAKGGKKINLHIVSQNETEDKNIAQAAKQEGRPLELMMFFITKCSEM